MKILILIFIGCFSALVHADVYDDLAKATGGTSSHQTKEEFLKNVHSTMAYDLAKNAPPILIAKINLPVEKTSKFTVPVDIKMSGMLLVEIHSADPTAAGIVIRDPRQTPLRPVASTKDSRAAIEVELSDRRVILQPEPLLGTWTVELKGPIDGSLIVRSQGARRIQTARFVRIGGRPGHQGDFPYDGPLVPGEKEKFEFGVYDAPAKSLRLSIVGEDGAEIDRIVRLEASSDELAMAKVTIPRVPFRLLVQGKTKDGSEFQRADDRLYTPTAR